MLVEIHGAPKLSRKQETMGFDVVSKQWPLGEYMRVSSYSVLLSNVAPFTNMV